jgi:predicted nucleic acid-binding protein
VKAFFDTSVLVATFYGDHQHHDASLEVFLKFDRKQGCCGAHSMAEVYAALTRMPGKHRISGEQAMLFLTTAKERLTIIALDEQEYFSTLDECATAGVVGGTVYDAILAQCALKAKAERIYTWNIRHFRQLGPEVTRRLRTP